MQRAPHGTCSRYKYELRKNGKGSACPECLEAWREYWRQYRKNKKENEKIQGS